MEHLSDNLQEIALKDNVTRIQFIKGNKWIGYTRAVETLELFDELIEGPRTTRMPDILLVGSSNNGKTVILDKFVQKYPTEFFEEEQEVRKKVLCVEAPPLPDEKRFYQNILTKLLVPFRKNHRADVLKIQVFNVLERLEVKVLIIDEIHHLLSGVGTKKQILLNALKSLSNELSISIIAAGTKDAYYVFQSDPQMSSRFETVPLPRWELNKEYVKFLVSYENILPLRKKSDLHQKEIAIKILSLTDRTIGGITSVIRKAAIKAIKTGEEKISMKLIDSLGIIHPDEMKKMPML